MSNKVTSLWMLLVCLAVLSFTVLAQVPTGIIAGTVTDATGAVIPNAPVTITDKATGAVRTVAANADGYFAAPSLPAGDYEVRIEMPGFRTLVRDATVQAGNTTTVNMQMQVGGEKEVVTVEAASAQVNYESHTIQGVVTRSTIQDLPLNGRSFMQLAALEPGVTVANGSTAQFNTLFTINVLGAGGGQTLITMDGGSIADNIDTASGQADMNFSQETVQEFQLSSINFDLATGITVGGAVNVVTRSGSNDFHGSAYFFFRDHNIAAYPGLIHNPLFPNPFFVRRNPGFWLSGPLKKDKLFFFFNFEDLNQVQATPVQGTVPSLALLSGIYGSPYVGHELTGRLDYHLNEKHSMFLRYSHDGNTGFGDVFSNGDPSNWVHNINWADQGLFGLTSILTPNVVNDFRFNLNYWSNKNLQANPSECVFPCVGGTLPALLTVLGTNFAFGNAAIGPNVNAPQARISRRYEIQDSVSWQKGSHRIKIGIDSNRIRSAGLWGFCTPYCEGVYSPESIRGLVPAALIPTLFPTLPTILRSDADFYNLPFLSLSTGIFTGVGVGSVSTPALYDRDQNLWQSQYRAYVQDTWKVRPNFTLTLGLAWNAQTGWYNSDLHYSALLAPLIGANNLNNPTQDNLDEFSPSIGFAWSPGTSQKWVIRGGAGLYWGGTPGYYKLREPAAIGPVGDGRQTLPSTVFTNIFPGIINLATQQPIPVGAPVPCCNALTNMTLGQFNQIYQQQIGAIQAQFGTPPTSGPYTTENIDISKTGIEIYPPGRYPLPRSYQTAIGFQRQLGWDTVVEADFVHRQNENTSIGEMDLNRFNTYVNGVQTPIIPKCPTLNLTPGVQCSNGPITFWEDEGRSVYNGLLVKVSKRFSHRVQFTASYALQNQNSVTIYDYANWFAGYGPVLARQNLNISGFVNLPWGFQLGINSSIISRTPVTALVPALDLPGTTPSSSSYFLPGLQPGCLNAGCSKSDLVKAVNAFNAKYAGTKDAKGNTIPYLVLPSDYQLGDPNFTQDFRLTKNFTFKEHYNLALFGEVFNAFNIANLTGYNFTLDTKSSASAANPTTFNFGQPTQRAFQGFGSSGPRAFQFGGRFTF